MYRRSFKTPVLYKTKEAKDWITEATKVIKQQRIKGTIKDTVDIAVNMYVTHDCDIDNRTKALLDILQSTNIIENDRLVYSLLINKIKDKIPRVEVEIRVNK